jgi:hypothetical protein
MQQRHRRLKSKFGQAIAAREGLKKKMPSAEAQRRSMAKLKGKEDLEGQYIPITEILEPEQVIAIDDYITDPKNMSYGDSLYLMNADETGAWDRMKRGRSLTPGNRKQVARLIPFMAEEAAQRVPHEMRWWEHLLQGVGLLKIGAALDIQSRRTLSRLRARHPAIYHKAIGRSIAAYYKKKYADKNIEDVKSSPYYSESSPYSSQASYGEGRLKNKLALMDTAEDHENPEQYYTQLAETNPLYAKLLAKGFGKKVGKGAEFTHKYTLGQFARVYNASMRGYITSANWAMQSLWDLRINQWERQGVDITDVMLRDLADSINTIAGLSKPRSGWGKALARTLAPIMWSPTLTFSRLKAPTQIVFNKTMRWEVAQILGADLAYGVALMGVATLIGARFWPDDWPEFSVEWDPSSTDFGKLKIGNARFGLFGDQGPYIRAIFQTIWPTKKSQAGRIRKVDYWSWDERSEPIKQLLRNKRAPLVDLVSKIATGTTFYGGEAFPQEQSKAFHATKETYERLAPFWFSGGIESAIDNGIPIGTVSALNEFFSGQSLSYEPSKRSQLQILEDVAALTAHNKLWDDLTLKQQEGLYKGTPEMADLELQIAKERGDIRPEELNLSKSNRVARQITKAMPEDVRKELRSLGVQIPGLTRTLRKLYLNDKRYAAYQKAVTAEIKKELTKRLSRPVYQTWSPKKKQEKLKEYITDAKTEAGDDIAREIKHGRL